MADSSESRKRSREPDSSDSLGFHGGAFDEGLSGESGAKSHDSESLLGDFSEVEAAEASGKNHGPRAPAVYQYDERGERLPGEQAPRPPKPRARSGEQGDREQECEEPSNARRDSLGSGVGEDFGGGGFAGWDENLEEGFEEDLYDDEETAEQAKRNPNWSRRTERELKEWEQSRHLFAAALLRRQAAGPGVCKAECSTPGCAGLQAVKCSECTQEQPVCSECDQRLHPHAHFHHREYLTPEGKCWQPIGPEFAVRHEKLVRCAKLFAKPPSAACAGCGMCSWGSARPTNKPLTVITLAGRFDFVRAAFSCQTAGCGGFHEQGSLDAIDLGAWPGTVSECRTMYDTALFEFWGKMSKDQPGASMTALVKVLEGISRDHGRVPSINRHTMTTAFGEFKMAQHSARYPAALQSGLVCPACWAKQHSCAVDSNRKLYRWARTYDPSRKSYYENIFFYPDKEVQASIKAIDVARGVERPDTACGTGEWKAARDSKSAIRGQDETGCTVCGCRHVFAQRAVNIVQMGERYANAYYLDRNFMQPTGVEFQWQDIVCKYWAWREKTLEAMDHGSGGDLKPALNLMHGKLHAWQCQVLFGGHWQDGAAAGAGEDMELLFSYLSRLGVITKVMGPARRMDAITEAVLHWNEAKARDLARSLVNRYLECQKRTESAVVAFETACQEILGGSAGAVPLEKLEGWKHEIRAVAEVQLRDSRRTKGSLAVQYFVLKREVESADSISPFVNSEAFKDSPLCSETLQNLSSATEELLRGRDAKVRKLRELEKQLFPELRGQPVGVDELMILEARSRATLAEETVHSLQEEMEGMLHSLEKLRLRVTTEADSSTMRSALRKKEALVKKQLGKVVERYNTILPKIQNEGSSQRQPAVLEVLMSGSELPWQFDRCLDVELEVSSGVHRTFRFKQKYELVEAFNKVKRLREESNLLLREQRSYLSFYTACKSELEARIKSWNEQLSEALETRSEQSGGASVLEVTGKYFVVDFDIASQVDLIRGTIARLWKAHAEAERQLRKGLLHFQRDAGGQGLPWPRRKKESLFSEQTDPFVEADHEEY